MNTTDHLERGRRASAGRAWTDAYAALSRADELEPLGPADLELLATAASMLGRDEDVARVLERAHLARLDAGEPLRAARNAFWLGLALADRGELGPASGWFARAGRLVEREEEPCVEQGYVLLPEMRRKLASGEAEEAMAAGHAAVEVAERFGDPDLLALALMGQGRALIEQGQVEEGLARLDEAMVAVTAEEVSPMVAGIVYCGLITGCHEAYEVRRAHEWTAALSAWCEEQPDMVAYTGECLVHRAEVMQLRGAWEDALEEARRADRRFAPRLEANRMNAGRAAYLQGELHRLRAEHAAAEESYRDASRFGREPQPGLALLRLAQGDVDAALAAVRLAAREGARAELLAACVEIALAAGEHEEAIRACDELEALARERDPRSVLGATAGAARGAVDLARGDAPRALAGLRRAAEAWRDLGAPYEAARARELVGLACRSLGDEDSGALELEAAREVYRELGAATDLARVDRLLPGEADAPGGLTEREIEVLRLVARGETNRAIAEELVISEKTVARHVSNIFRKLRVPSRAAATAWAYEQRLV